MVNSQEMCYQQTEIISFQFWIQICNDSYIDRVQIPRIERIKRIAASEAVRVQIRPGVVPNENGFVLVFN